VVLIVHNGWRFALTLSTKHRLGKVEEQRLELRNSLNIFEENPLRGAIATLSAIIQNFGYDQKLEFYLTPLNTLLRALEDLEDGVVAPILKATPVSNRPKKHRDRLMYEAFAVAAVDQLVSLGIKKDEAYKKIAKNLPDLTADQLRHKKGEFSRKNIRERTGYGFYLDATTSLGKLQAFFKAVLQVAGMNNRANDFLENTLIQTLEFMIHSSLISKPPKGKPSLAEHADYMYLRAQERLKTKKITRQSWMMLKNMRGKYPHGSRR
jgi:hypothetical protein